MAPGRRSAGILLHRTDGGVLEVLLGHMGGPFWARRERAWTVPKGEPGPDEELHTAAVREFTEETGLALPAGPEIPLGTVRQRAGKEVTVWARAADLDVSGFAPQATVAVEWPPRSGRTTLVPELDRLRWWPVTEARALVVDAQTAFLDRLVEAAGAR